MPAAPRAKRTARSAKKIPIHALSKLVSSPWAMREEVLSQFVSIVNREDLGLEALDVYGDKPMGDKLRPYRRGSTAVIPFCGPVFRYADWMQEICGATSYERFAAAFADAIGDSSVQTIVIEFNSPGGEVTGCDSASRAVFDARGTKPIIAYVDGDACSAAYWVASACDEIIVSPTAVLGSIGVVGIYTDDSEAKKAAGLKTYEIVSNVSPDKRPDPSSKDGRTAIQAMIDDTADVFVASVARNRGVSIDTVLTKFGRGGVFVGQAAIEAGLADDVGTLEDLMAEIEKTSESKSDLQVPYAANNPRSKSRGTRSRASAVESEVKLKSTGSKTAIAAAKKADDEEMSRKHAKAPVDDNDPENDPDEQEPDEDEDDETETKADDDSGSDLTNPGTPPGQTTDPRPKRGPSKQSQKPKEDVVSERNRIKAILGSDAAKGREDLASYLAYDTDMTAEAAVAMLGKAPVATVAAAPVVPANALATAMAGAPNPTDLIAATGSGAAPVASADPSKWSSEDVLKRVTALGAQVGICKAA